jgi:hypothetical protein
MRLLAADAGARRYPAAAVDDFCFTASRPASFARRLLRGEVVAHAPEEVSGTGLPGA